MNLEKSDGPTLTWVNTGKDKVGLWPCLVFGSYDAAVFSGLKIPSPSSQEMKDIKNKMCLSTQHVMLYMIEIHVWTCLAKTSRRIRPSLGEFDDFEVVERNNNRAREYHEVASLRNALNHSKCIYNIGFDAWLVNEQKKETCLLVGDILKSEFPTALGDNVDMTNEWLKMLPLTFSLLDGEYYIETGRDKWISSFLRLYQSLIEPMGITEMPEESNVCNPNKTRPISPSNVLDISLIEEGVKLPVIIHTGPYTGILDCSIALELPKDTASTKATYKAMVESLVSRSIESSYYFPESYSYLINSEAKEKMDEAIYYVQMSKFRDAFDTFEVVLSYSDNDDELSGDVIHNMAVINFIVNNYDIRLCEEALLVRNAALPNGHPKIAESLRLLGLVRLYHGDFERALECFNRAHVIFQAAYGRHAAVSSMLKCIGCVHFLLDQLFEAINSFEKAIQMDQVLLFTDDDASVEETLKVMASTLYHIGQIQMKTENNTCVERAKLTFNEVNMVSFEALIYCEKSFLTETYSKIFNLLD